MSEQTQVKTTNVEVRLQVTTKTQRRLQQVRDWLSGGMKIKKSWPKRLKLAQKSKKPVKLIKRMKIAHSFLQSVSNQFHVIILSLPM